MHIHEVLRRPVVTEKGTVLKEQNKYIFEAQRKANKAQIKEAVEKAFGVTVISVNVINMPRKARGFGRLRGYRSQWKKAVVTLKEGDKIEVFDGV